MTVGNIWDIFGALAVIGLATTLVAHPGTAKVVSATGTAFAGSLRAAQGR